MPELSQSFHSIFESFKDKKLLVIGDLMLDRYLIGNVSRISPEAPVPIIDLQTEENMLGGSANVVLNLTALGAKAIPLGLVGDDLEGRVVLTKFEEMAVRSHSIIVSKERKTTLKTRIMAGRQQVVRVDSEQLFDLTENELNALSKNFHDHLDTQEVNGIVLQDYNKGVLSETFIDIITKEANHHGIPFFVDPKLKNFWEYAGAAIFKPNLKEVREALSIKVEPTLESLTKASAAIKNRLGCKVVMITLSDLGIFIDDGIHCEIFPTKPRNVADPCGAGDTVISVAALASLANCDAKDIAMLANIAGGQVVEKSGVAVVDKELLLHDVVNNKI